MSPVHISHSLTACVKITTTNINHYIHVIWNSVMFDKVWIKYSLHPLPFSFYVTIVWPCSAKVKYIIGLSVSSPRILFQSSILLWMICIQKLMCIFHYSWWNEVLICFLMEDKNRINSKEAIPSSSNASQYAKTE